MKKKIFPLIALALALTMVFALAACGGTVNFKEYSYTPKPADQNDWKAQDLDEGMQVDGVFDESVYEGLEEQSFLNSIGNKFTMRVYMGGKGVYFAIDVEDNAIYYNNDRAVYINTSVELHIAPAGTKILSRDCVQLRIGIDPKTKYVEQWVGTRSDTDTYAWTRAYVPSMSAFKINGTINTSDNEGYTVEVFMPYKSIGITEQPNEILVLPAFNHIATDSPSASMTDRINASPSGTQHEKPSTYWRYKAEKSSDGQITVDGDLSDWTDAEVLASKKTFKDGSSEKGYDLMAFSTEAGTYIAYTARHGLFVPGETNFVPGEPDKDWWLNTNAEFFDGSGTQYWVVSNRHSANVTEAAMVSTPADNGAVKAQTTVEIFLKGVTAEKFRFYFKTVDDKATMPDGKAGDYWALDGGAMFNVTADGLEKVVDFTPVGKTIDGDLSDWTDETILANGVEFADANRTGKGFKAWAYLDDTGMYIAYEAKHSVYKTDADAWWKNTNIEINTMGTQRYINAKGEKGNLAEGVMKTTAPTQDGGLYTTTAELFIPLNQLVYENFGENDLLALCGFAFKTEGDLASGRIDNPNKKFKDMGFSDEDWWRFIDHPVGEVGAQHYVTRTGIHAIDPRP